MPTADDLYVRLSRIATELKSAQSLVDGWTRSGGTTPNFEFLKAVNARFGTAPLESALWTRDTTMLILADWTDVTFETEHWNNGPWAFSSASASFQHARPQEADSYWFFGWARFSTNSSGGVGVRFVREGFVSGVASTQFDIVATYKCITGAPAGIGNVIPFMYPLRANSSATGWRWQVFQNGAASTHFVSMSIGVITMARL